MKKIVSLVLALVLVLAIAAPAMAITGSVNPDITPASKNAPFTDIDLVLIEATPLNNLGVLSLQAVAANKAYVVNSLVNYALFFKVPAADKIAYNSNDYIDPAAVIASDVVSFASTKVATLYKVNTGTGVSSATLTGSDSADGKTLTVDLPTTGTVNVAPAATGNPDSFVLVGTGVVVANANGTIVASIYGDKDHLKFKPFEYTEAGIKAIIATGTNFPLSIYDGGTAAKYVVEAAYDGADTITYTVTKAATGSGSSTVPSYKVFFMTSLKKTAASGSTSNMLENGIRIEYEGNTYIVDDSAAIISGGGASALKFIDTAAGSPAVSDATKAKLTAAYNAVMTDFGFSYTAAGVLHPEHFARKASTFLGYDSAAVTLYTGSIVVPDEGTEPPQTGDAATSIGFVMIALAIVAAAGVAYKKVRA